VNVGDRDRSDLGTMLACKLPRVTQQRTPVLALFNQCDHIGRCLTADKARDFGEIGQLMLVERKPDPVASGKPKARELHEAAPPAHGRSVSFQ
jgi:uncharacterized protein YwlG (UPF0340 family)